METIHIVALVLLSVFSSLFVFCFVVTQVRQRLQAKRKHRDWEARYHQRAQRRLENKRRIWAMFGLRYDGTIDDVRQSDDEDDEDDEVRGKSRFSAHGPAAAHVVCPNGSPSDIQSPPPPPPYTTCQLGLRTATLSPPQFPERFHDKRRDEDVNHEIASPRPRRHFQLRAPELVACGPLRRSSTIRSTRRYSVSPEPKAAPELNSVHGPNAKSPGTITESPNSSVRTEPPMSPRRLDSISRR